MTTSTWQDKDEKMTECKLLSGEFAAFLQVLLGLIAFSVLVVKRLHETPQRPVMVWAFDAAKQMIGATFAHVANLFIAIVLYSHQQEISESDHEPVDQCALYFVNFTLDTTFGVLVNYILLSGVILLARRLDWSSLKTPGDYGTPVGFRTWGLQVLSWILVIFSCKFLIAILIVVFQKPLGALAVLLFKPLTNHPDVELTIVMIACPCSMNAMQFWIQDNFLKKDVRDESCIVSQAAQSPTSSLNDDDDDDDKVPSVGTLTDEECEPGDSKSIVAMKDKTQDVEAKKKRQLDVAAV